MMPVSIFALHTISPVVFTLMAFVFLGIAEAAYDMNIPVYYIHFKDDWLARSEFAEMSHKQPVKATYKMDAIDTTHWCVLSHSATVNNMLLTWLSEQKI